jgi:hypothetical protein
MKKELEPGWFFTAWKEHEMDKTMVSTGPFVTAQEAVAEVLKTKREGYMCGLPYFVGPKLDLASMPGTEAA